MSSAYFPHFFMFYDRRNKQQNAKQTERKNRETESEFISIILSMTMRQLTLSASLDRNGQFLQIWHQIYESFESNLYVNRLVRTVSRFIHSFIRQQREREANTFAQMVSHLIGECVWVVFPTVTHSHHMTRPTANSVRSQYTEYYHILRASVSVFECDVCDSDSSGEANLSNVCIVVVLFELVFVSPIVQKQQKNNYFCCCCRSFWRQVNGLFVLYLFGFVSEIIFCNEFVRTYARRV